MGRCCVKWRLRWRRRGCESCGSPCHLSCPKWSSAKSIKTGCTKSYLVVLNLTFLICGGMVLGLGFWMYVERQTYVYMELLHNFPSTSFLVLFDRLPSVFIFIGGSVAILSFLGCCGACADSAFFLCLYTLLLCMILVTEVVIAIVILAFRNEILLKLESSLQYQIRHEYNKSGISSNHTTSSETERITVLLDAMQVKWNCCGATSSKDYYYSAWFNYSKLNNNELQRYVPLSCCVASDNRSFNRHRIPAVKDENQCQLDAIRFLYPGKEKNEQEPPPTDLKTQGCQRTMVGWFGTNTFVIISVVSLVIVLQILDLSSACVLMAIVKQKHSDCHWPDEAEIE